MEARVPPHSEDAERGLLGSIFTDSDKCMKVCGEHGITEESFYIPAHKHLFSVLAEMKDKDMAVDLVTIGEHLNKTGRLDAVGGYGFLEVIMDSTPTSAHVEYYAGFVSEKERRRRAIEVATSTIEQCYNEEEITTIIEDSKDKMREIGVSLSRERVTTTDDIMTHAERARNGEIDSAPLPFDKLNRRTGGVPYRMVTVFTGRSKSGKSMMKSFWQRKLGEAGVPTLDLCFEDKARIAKTRTASVGNFNASALLKGGRFMQVGGVWQWIETDDRTMRIAREQLDYVDKLPLHWYDAPCTGKQMRSIVERYVDQHGVRVVFIDGMKSVLRPSGKYNDTGYDEELSAITVEMAERFDLAVVPIYHLTKFDKDTLITDTNIRGSANIIADCRSVYALQGCDGVMGEGIGGIDQFGGCTPNIEDGRCTTRVFQCLGTNHGETGHTILETDLSKCDFWSV